MFHAPLWTLVDLTASREINWKTNAQEVYVNLAMAIRSAWAPRRQCSADTLVCAPRGAAPHDDGVPLLTAYGGQVANVRSASPAWHTSPLATGAEPLGCVFSCVCVCGLWLSGRCARANETLFPVEPRERRSALGSAAARSEPPKTPVSDCRFSVPSEATSCRACWPQQWRTSTICILYRCTSSRCAAAFWRLSESRKASGVQRRVAMSALSSSPAAGARAASRRSSSREFERHAIYQTLAGRAECARFTSRELLE